jgi:hypothetical protein
MHKLCSSSCKHARTQSDAATSGVPLEERWGAPVAVGQVRHHEAATHLRASVLTLATGGFFWLLVYSLYDIQLAQRLRTAQRRRSRVVLVEPSCWAQ